MSQRPVHAFGADPLGEHDGVALAALLRSGQLDTCEVTRAAIERVQSVEPSLHAVAADTYARPIAALPGPLHGVPTFVKDNTPVRGLPTRHGSAAVPGTPARADGAFTRQLRSAGFTVLGKTKLPEFGLNATTEYAGGEPVHNPWHTGHSSGGSSGGAAALVASGAVPIAHGNDGGGSIRIPAACCGLVGLKPTRGRLVASELAKMPVNLVVDGVLTRTVRDTAAFFAAAEGYRRAPGMPPLGHVRGPSARRMRIGLVLESVNDAPVCAETRAAVEATAKALEQLGHTVEPIELPFGERFVQDFLTYWGMLAFLLSSLGNRTFGAGFDPARVEPLTAGLRARYARALHRTPGMLYRLGRAHAAYATMFERHDVVLSPVLAHPAPPLGTLDPTLPTEQLLERLKRYVAFTPLANVTGAPAISIPAAVSGEGIPIGVMCSAAHGDERTLLEVAYALEQARPWPRIGE